MSGWTNKRVLDLTEMWSAGLSASQIAARFGDISRNAVIGKVHRLGLPGRLVKVRTSSRGFIIQPSNFNEPKPKKFQSQPPNPHADFVRRLEAEMKISIKHEPVEPPADCRNVPLLDLHANACRWPTNDAAPGETHLFCGAEQEENSPYCAPHGRIAFKGLSMSIRRAA